MVKQQRIVLLAAGLAGALMAAVLLVGAVAEVAAQGGQGRPGIGRGHFGPGGPGVFGPGGLGLEGANLTEAQREQVRAVVDQHRDEIRGLFERVTQARRALSASAERGQVDEAAASQVGEASAALALAEARIRAEVLQLLTPEQRAAVQKRVEERAERRRQNSRYVAAGLQTRLSRSIQWPNRMVRPFLCTALDGVGTRWPRLPPRHRPPRRWPICNAAPHPAITRPRPLSAPSTKPETACRATPPRPRRSISRPPTPGTPGRRPTSPRCISTAPACAAIPPPRCDGCVAPPPPATRSRSSIWACCSRPATRRWHATPPQAAHWYRMAADRGSMAAQFHLARLYENGLGVARDRDQAAAWYRKAADRADPAAQLRLGILLSPGNGARTDVVAAHMWLNLSASRWKNEALRVEAAAAAGCAGGAA